MRNLLAAALLLTFPAAASTALAQAATQVAIYPMVDCATPGSTHIEIFAPWGQCMAPTPILTERDFAHLQRLQFRNPTPFLRADLKPGARQRYYDFALSHRLTHAAIRVDGHTMRIITVEPLHRPAWLILSGGRMTNAQLDAVASGYREQYGHT